MSRQFAIIRVRIKTSQKPRDPSNYIKPDPNMRPASIKTNKAQIYPNPARQNPSLASDLFTPRPN